MITANFENQTPIMNTLSNQFKYNYLENRLWEIKEGDILLEIAENEQFFTQYNGLGFNLAEKTWLVFNLYIDRIKVFYKRTLADGQIIYYQKHLPKEEIIEWEFTYLDIVEKVEGKWTYRNKENT